MEDLVEAEGLLEGSSVDMDAWKALVAVHQDIANLRVADNLLAGHMETLHLVAYGLAFYWGIHEVVDVEVHLGDKVMDAYLDLYESLLVEVDDLLTQNRRCYCWEESLLQGTYGDPGGDETYGVEVL